MGQAFDRDGNILGEAEGNSAREVLEKLERHSEAAEFRIRTQEATRAGEYDPPRAAPERLSLENVEQIFTYQPWNADQQLRGLEVRNALIEAAKVILRNVPSCPTRTRALNDLIDARMKANAAITHDGRY